jgi:hypothetical protein
LYNSDASKLDNKKKKQRSKSCKTNGAKDLAECYLGHRLSFDANKQVEKYLAPGTI